ncbi:MAG: TlyA family rRNA (cytidine-2'-O)-methyltransferase [Anaerolineae bacterium]|nr:MAG: TlyA family rRNA (cytidine-2'-O)-methyltransferase [Anaerolineae bacterium]
MPKVRLDILLVERGLVESRAKAQAVILAGQVRVNGQVVDKASALVEAAVALTVDGGPRFVSRGGEKLLAALQAFPVNPQGLVCADVGASTGGFTDCLLQHGASKVYAIDVGKGILHWKLRNDPRVVVMEQTNARYVECLPEPVQLVVCDASFISLKVLLPVMKQWLPGVPVASPLFSEAGEGDIITLIKPQFEAGRKEAARGEGVIRDSAVHKRILREVLEFAVEMGLGVRGLVKSPLLGPKGNVEFLAWLDLRSEPSEIEMLVKQAVG